MTKPTTLVSFTALGVYSCVMIAFILSMPPPQKPLSNDEWIHQVVIPDYCTNVVHCTPGNTTIMFCEHDFIAHKDFCAKERY